MSLSSLRRLFDQFGFRPKKSLGQNFLYDPIWLARVADAAEVGPEDLVLEIGPGAGSLTEVLARRAGQVVAVELDANLLPLLHHTLAGCDNVTIVQGDILEFPVPELLRVEPGRAQRYKVVANIPYYVTAAILRHLLQARLKPELAVLTVQQEVAERIVAAPGDMSLLAVSVQFYGEPRIVARIPAGVFYPRPDVDSAILRIDLFSSPRVRVSREDWFFRVVKAGFAQRRKQLHNALSNGLGLERGLVVEALEAAGIDPRRRAETVALEEWGRLSARLEGGPPGAAP